MRIRTREETKQKRVRRNPIIRDVLALYGSPDAILCSDLHLREDSPVCRIDDYWKSQWKKIRWLSRLYWETNQPTIICAGDVFHHWKPSPFLLNTAMDLFPLFMLAIPGQHDLPQHNMDLMEKSGISVLSHKNVAILREGEPHRSSHFGEIHGFPFESKLGPAPKPYGRANRMVAVIHTLVYSGKKPFPEAPKEGNANRILNQLKGFDLIVSGDNHETFVVEEYNTRTGKNQLLVNPGSMMRMTTDQQDHRPCVFLWYANANSVIPLYYPIEEGVITRDHIERSEKRENRMASFIKTLNSEFLVDLSFRESMRKAIRKNKVSKEVSQLIEEAMERDE